MDTSTDWPELKIEDWGDSCKTLHMWTQVVGKIRTLQVPWINHSWHSTLYVTPRGLTTLSMPHGEKTFQVEFDFHDHRLSISSSAGPSSDLELKPRSVADFYELLLSRLADMDLAVSIHGSPNEVDPSIPFAENEEDSSYDADAVRNFHRALVQADRVMQQFRAGFRGKCSPVHFFWGSFDLAVTRFSGRTAPEHPGGFPNMPDWITREAYSHEVSSCGFWPGGQGQEAIFYSYAYPTPDGFAEHPVNPGAGEWNQDLGEFVLPYSAVQQSPTPYQDLLAFFQTTYDAAAEKASWDRKALEWNGPDRNA